MDDISTRKIDLTRKELYILIDAMEKELDRVGNEDFEKGLEDNSEKYDDLDELLERFQNLLGE
jgi:hypothetical protein